MLLLEFNDKKVKYLLRSYYILNIIMNKKNYSKYYILYQALVSCICCAFM